jgi:anti-sigma factor RsiW
MLTCREFVEFLMAYLSGELPAEQRAVFEEHLRDCRCCTTYLRTYEQTVDIEKIACGCCDPPPADVPEDLIRAILAARTPTRSVSEE